MSLTDDIIERANIQRYIPPPSAVFRGPGEGVLRKRKPPRAIRTKDIGPYHLVMEWRDYRCRIRLYEYTADWKRRLKATWSGEGGYCDTKFEQISEVIKQVRFEEKTQLMR